MLFKRNLGKVVMFRHAPSTHNITQKCAGNYNLSIPTPEGLEKTRQVGQLLAKNKIKLDIFYVSPLERAIITAKTLLKELPPTPMIIDESLAERRFGAFVRRSKKQIKEQLSPDDFNRYLYDKNFLPPKIEFGHEFFNSEALYGIAPDKYVGESYQCVMNRQKEFIKRMRKQILNGFNMGIVGHHQNLQLLFMDLHGTTFEDGIDQYKIAHVTPIQLTFTLNASQNLIITDKTDLLEKFMDVECKPNLPPRPW